MKHIQRIQNAIDFIEKNLDRDFTLPDVSKSAFSALSYMHRVFYQMTGFTMKDYVRQRRFAESVKRLRSSQYSVLDIALRAGFQSAESFSRAFKKHFSITPSECRCNEHEINVCQPLDVRNEFEFISPSHLDFEITLEAVSYHQQDILGFLTHTTLAHDQQVVDICRFANEVITSGKLASHFDLAATPVFGVYTNMNDENEFDYTIACLKSACVRPDLSMVEHSIFSSTYAKFTLNRSDRIKQAWHYIYGVWFPQIDRLRTQGYDFEIYYSDHTDIYIPMERVPLTLMSFGT